MRAEAAATLRFIPYADLALLGPAVSAFVARNHVVMVFDTLLATNEAGQTLAGHATEADSLTWPLTLRPGLKFHGGAPVLARDAVASIRRRWVNDAFGQALAAATDDLSARDDNTIGSASSAASTCCPRRSATRPTPWPPSCRNAWRIDKAKHHFARRLAVMTRKMMRLQRLLSRHSWLVPRMPA